MMFLWWPEEPAARAKAWTHLGPLFTRNLLPQLEHFCLRESQAFGPDMRGVPGWPEGKEVTEPCGNEPMRGSRLVLLGCFKGKAKGKSCLVEVKLCLCLRVRLLGLVQMQAKSTTTVLEEKTPISRFLAHRFLSIWPIR